LVNEVDDESTTNYGYKSQHDFPITVVK